MAEDGRRSSLRSHRARSACLGRPPTVVVGFAHRLQLGLPLVGVTADSGEYLVAQAAVKPRATVAAARPAAELPAVFVEVLAAVHRVVDHCFDQFYRVNRFFNMSPILALLLRVRTRGPQSW